MNLQQMNWIAQIDKTEFEKLYSETLSTIAENEVIDGTVISMNKREVVINIGYKSEGVISISVNSVMILI